MIREICQRAFGVARDFLRNQSGSIVIYTGAFMAVGVGGAALSIDIGRIVLLKTQMQNRADAGALAGAAQLDAQPGAVDRAKTIMEDSMTAYTTAAADQGELATWESHFYAAGSDYISRGVETTDDVAARFAQVLMQRRTLSFFYAPALNIMTGQTASSYTELDAGAVAMSDPFICKTLPMMICNPLETETNKEIPGDTYAGKSISLKQGIQGGGTWQAGNFGLLELPTDADYGAGGAAAVEAALAADDPDGCYGYNIVTAPGSMTIKVEDGLNTRFGMPVTDPAISPAPNVMGYPKDQTWELPNLLGNADWDLATYWATNHAGVPLPSDLAGATRYQVYLFEQGQGYCKKNAKNVLLTTLDQCSKGGYTWVDPSLYPTAAVIPTNPSSPDDVWTDGEPPPGQTVSPKGQDRRIIRINIMNCIQNEVSGKGTYPSEGGYVEMFVTEPAEDPGDGAAIYGEFVRKLDPRISLEFHGNVRLVE